MPLTKNVHMSKALKKNTEKVEKFDPRKSGNPVHGMLWIYSALYTICTLFQPIYLNSAPNLEDFELLEIFSRVNFLPSCGFVTLADPKVCNRCQSRVEITMGLDAV